MATAKVTSKGQITIPLEVRRKLGLRPGSQLDFIPTPDGGFRVEPLRGSLASLEGIFHSAGGTRPVSLEEMEEATAAEAVESTFRHASDGIGPAA